MSTAKVNAAPCLDIPPIPAVPGNVVDVAVNALGSADHEFHEAVLAVDAPEGVWHIIEMEMWDEKYFNMEVQAFIRVGSDGMGDFQFCLVSGVIDGEEVKTDNAE